MKNIIIENDVIKSKNKIPLNWMFLFYCYMFSLFLIFTFRVEKININLLTELIVTFIYSFYSSHFLYFLLFPLTNNSHTYHLTKGRIYWLSFKRLLKVLLFFYVIPFFILVLFLKFIISKNPFLIIYFAAMLGQS